MRYAFKKTGMLLVFTSILFTSRSQVFENPGQYMDYIGQANEKVTTLYLSYLSALGHGKSARKVDKRRQEVVDNIFQTRMNIAGMPPWKGDKSYRDTTVAYFKLMYNVFNEDYAKIMNMEEIAEQSYDAMEAYMLAQEKAAEKLQQASERQRVVQKEFAEKHNINLVDNTSELEMKSKVASELMKHYDAVYLVFFKANKQEVYLMEAVNKKNITSIEQNKSALKGFAEEGLEKLKKLTAFSNDPSLINACRESMHFYKSEADRMQIATDFLLKEESFNRAKKAFDTKPQSKRTKEDVDAYNKAVNDFNAAINDFNSTNKALDKERERALDNWNKTVKKYLDTYMPVHKK